MKEELIPKKIYKNVIPSNILEYVGGNTHRKNNSSLITSQFYNYSIKRNSLLKNSKDTSQITIPLNPVIENFKKDEESSSSDSNNSNGNNSIKSHEILKQYKSVNINYRVSNSNLNKKVNSNKNIYSSTNRLYNYKSNKKILDKYYINFVNENKVEKYNNYQDDIYSRMSKSFKSSKDEERSEFYLDNGQDSDEEDQKEEENHKITNGQKKEDFHNKKKNIKKIFYVLMFTFYYSLYLLCLKISLKLSMPEIPALGVSSFIISFNLLFISLLFMKLDQVTFKDYLNLDKIDNYFFKIVFNYIKLLLTIKSLQNLKLFSFVLIFNMNSIMISYISLKENNRSYKPLDFVSYFVFILIIICEFIVNNKISMLCLITLMILNTFIFFTNINSIKNMHSYLVDLGSSLIGIAISPIIMTLNKDSFNISVSQYLLFAIICIPYFLYNYFEKKYDYFSLGQGCKIYSNVLIICLYIFYSNFLLEEKSQFNSYLFLIFSFFINIYGKMRINNSLV